MSTYWEYTADGIVGLGILEFDSGVLVFPSQYFVMLENCYMYKTSRN